MLDFVNQYGLLGLIHDLPVNRYYTLDKKVLLKEFNNITGIEYYDCLNTMDIINYFKVFFPTATDEEIKDLIEKSNNIDENFKLYAIQEKKYLKLCKHCGKAFVASNPKTEYDTFSCKNQENVYNSIARLSSNVTRTKDGLTVKITPSEELSNEIIKKLKKKK